MITTTRPNTRTFLTIADGEGEPGDLAVPPASAGLVAVRLT
ncbi:hypothetical protein [Lentzea flava]|nr:hypothetical protein [Lentzea flava]MCP2203432.1 hypothetical protein [Lentzea flava]